LRIRVRSGEITESTFAIDMNRLKRFIDFCTSCDVHVIDGVSSAVVEEFARHLRDRGCAGRTIDRYFDTIRKVVPHKLTLRRSGIRRGTGKEIPQNVLKAILAELPPVMRMYFLLLAETGLRPPQLAKVQTHWIQDTELDDQQVTYINFPPESFIASKRAPLTLLNDNAKAVIAALPCRGKYLFDDGNGLPLITRPIYYRAWRRAVIKLGFPEYRPYDVRHTFSIREGLRTGDFIYVAACLGNDPQTTVAYYSNLSTARLMQRGRGKSITGSMVKDFLTPSEPAE
jgi:integrase